MKVSVSLPDDDVAFLDDYADRIGLTSRSAAVHNAIRLLQASALGEAYAHAWRQWDTDSDARLWDVASGDGLGNATR
jgi:Arc/MetJ-type ribon-helix-helix transcriptional regulator